MGLAHKLRSRQGQFFSVTAVILLIVLTIIITVATQQTSIDTDLYAVRNADVTRERLERVYFPTVLRTASFDTMNALSQDAITANRFLILPTDYATGVENATWRGRSLSTRTLGQHMVLLANVTNSTGLSLTVYARNVNIVQSGVFTARASMDVSYNLSTRDNRVRYERNVTVVTTVPLDGVLDVYYTRSATAQGLPNPARIFRSHATQGWNNTEFATLWASGEYAYHNESPSVFDRLQGITLGSRFGVESFIPRTVAIPDNTTSVDVEYFTDEQFECTYFVNDAALPVALRVSYETLTEYNLTNGENVQSNPLCPAPPTWP